MSAVPTLPSVTGGVYTTSQLSQLVQYALFLMTPPMAKLRRTTTQSINNNAWTAILFDAEDADNYGGHSTTSNTDQYVVQVTGLYLLTGSADFVFNNTGTRGARFTVNGTAIPGSTVTPTATTGGNLWSACISTPTPLNVGDIVRLEVLQDSGAPLNANGNTPLFGCTLGIAWQTSL